MFRRLPTSLPQDPNIPADLEGLGYFVNEEDRMRMIAKPEQRYLYRINRNERVNDVYREAANACVRKIVMDRLLDAGLEVVRLPMGAKADERHVPIYVSKNIRSKKRVTILFGERNQDLGIFSYRSMGEDGISVGSAVEFVNGVTNNSTSTSMDDTAGVLIANPGQLIWYRAGGRAISYQEYLGVPRVSAVHGPFRIDPVKNRVPGNASHEEHVKYIFEHVLGEIVREDAKLDIIGLEYTGDAVMKYLAQNWGVWSDRVNGICLGNPQLKLAELNSLANQEFATFLSKRARAYFVSDKPVETPLPGRDEHGYNCYSSGEQFYEEGILVKSWRSMLDWFNMVSMLHDYEEPVFTMIEEADLDGNGV